MAQTVTLEGLRSQIVVSVFGRRIGFDSGNFLVGVPGLRRPITALTTSSTAADQIPAYGVVTLQTTSTGGSTFWSTTQPVPGESVFISNIATGYGTVYLNGSTVTTAVVGYFGGTSAAGFLSTATKITLAGKGAWCRLTGLSTAIWQIEMNAGDTAGSTDRSSAV